MSIDRKRDFLKNLYNAYATVGFVDEFWTPFDLNDKDKNYVEKPFKMIRKSNLKMDIKWMHIQKKSI